MKLFSEKKRMFLLFAVMIVAACSIRPAERDENKKIPLQEDMVLIPAGEFIMGADFTDAEWEKEKKRLRAVSIPIKPFPRGKVFVDAFYISRHETTNAQFKQFLDAGGYRKSKYWSKDGWKMVRGKKLKEPKYWGEKISRVNSTMDYPNHPVLGTSWYEANAYARWRGKRLPTEIEWEKAARGTDGREWPWGNVFDVFKCNYYGSGIFSTSIVGGYVDGASPYGIMDMCVNIYEFTSDYLGDEETIQKKYPDTPVTNGGIVLRGASWSDSSDINKVWRRFMTSIEERERGRHNGIRLAMDREK